MRITKNAARELIRSELALTKGLPSEEFLDEAFALLREQGDWQLSAAFFLLYDPEGEIYELDFA